MQAPANESRAKGAATDATAAGDTASRGRATAGDPAKGALEKRLTRVLTLLLTAIALATMVTSTLLHLSTARTQLENFQDLIRRSLDSQGRTLASSHARLYQSLFADNALLEIDRTVARLVLEDRDVLYGVVVSDRGQVLAYASPTAPPLLAEANSELPTHEAAAVARELTLPAEQLAVDRPTTRELRAFGQAAVEFSSPVEVSGEPAGSFRYGLSAARMQSEIEEARRESDARLRGTILLVGVVTLLTVIVGWLVVTRMAAHITDPISRLTRAARAFSLGQRHPSVEISTNDEIATLGRAFNGMVEELDASYARLENQNQLLVSEVAERQRIQEQREELEGQLLQAQKMEAFGQVAGGVAHDFNNILAIVVGQSELVLEALEERGTDPALLEDMDMILQAGERGANLTRQLLAFSRREKSNPRAVRLGDVVLGLEPLLRRVIEEHVTIRIEREGNEPRVLLDPGRFEQVLMNLVVNARDAMPKGGQLTISTSSELRAESGSTETGFAASGEYGVLTVRDTGTGMTEDVIERIFEPFFTTKSAGLGTGLGLATVHGIVRDAGGHIDVTSTVGGGTTFVVRIPVAETDIEDTLIEEIPANLGGSGQLVIVCEDEAAVRKLTTRLLRRAGYDVRAAATGEAAAEAIFRAERPVSLLVTDVVMPTMNGPDLVRRIEGTHPRLPVLYTSGYTDDLLANHDIGGGARSLLRKPFRAVELLSAVAQLLKSSDAAGGLSASSAPPPA